MADGKGLNPLKQVNDFQEMEDHYSGVVKNLKS